MSAYEIVCYFALKNLGSKLLDVVDVVWEDLDEIEKQMVNSLRIKSACTLAIHSHLPQVELERQLQETPFIALA